MKVDDLVRYRPKWRGTAPRSRDPNEIYRVLCVDRDGNGYIHTNSDADYEERGAICPCGRHNWIVLKEKAEIIGIDSTIESVAELKSEVTKIKPMTNLIQKFKLTITAEPERSFIEKGIMTYNQEMTAEGKQLFDAFLFEKNKAEFKTEVVDKIELDK